MYACKVVCHTTLYVDYGDREPDLATTQEIFSKRFLKTITPVLRVTHLHNYKHWQNKYNEIAASAIVEVLVSYDQHVHYLADYESLACRTVRRLLPTEGAAVQVTASEWLTPPRPKGFSL
ncbi:hypothetical protein [Shouchella patagoniensis]|uniref:hypothetical protein n=1 Tax=Shouchella patagoniensis TaxID=228576 RepID=UPI0009958214|nr:hypothetical protein [Shouchella patagoniensis]